MSSEDDEWLKQLGYKFREIASRMAKYECKDRQFEYTEENLNVIRGLLLYFTGDPACELPPYNLDRRLGIRLVGNTGSGKTMIMRVMEEMFRNQRQINQSTTMKSAIEIVEEFDEDGRAILNYGRNAIYVQKPTGLITKRNLIIDDWGKEDMGVFYKKNKNVIGSILDVRYDLWLKYGLKTHTTDNMPDDVLIEKYGDRIFYRMKQITNYVVLGGSKEYRNWRNV